MTQPNAQAASPKQWKLPINVERYDRRSELTESEKEALFCFVSHFTGKMSSWPRETKSVLHRFVLPLQDVLDFLRIPSKYRATPMSIILREMHERGTSYWAWPEEVWHEILQLLKTV